jgi:uncharacterized membrane protein
MDGSGRSRAIVRRNPLVGGGGGWCAEGAEPGVGWYLPGTDMKFRLKSAAWPLEKVYLVIALSSGLLMAAINPPFSGVPDEQPHFLKAWAVAKGDFTCRTGNTIPKSAYRLSIAYPVLAKIPGVGEKVLFHKTLKKFLDQDDLTEPTENKFAVCGAAPLGYLPQAAALRIGALFHWSALAGFYLARVFNLLVAVLLVYWAMRIIPFGKIVLLVIGLLPMTIQQFASLGYDALHIGASLLFIAYVTRLAVEARNPVRARDAAALLLLGLLVCTVKYGYLGLTLLIFLLPASKFKDQKRYWLFALGYVAFNVLVFYLVYRYFQAHLAPGGGPGLAKVSPVRQYEHVVGSPLRFLLTVIDSLYVMFNFYFETFLFKPGWLNVSLPPLWYALMATGMVVLVHNEAEDVPLTGRQRRIMLGVFLLNAIAIFFSMYIAWTPVGAPIITGVQGRYFLNIFPLLVFFFYKTGSPPTHEWVRKNMRVFLVLFYLVMVGWTFLLLYKIYYDKEPEVSLVVKLHGKLFGRH